MSNAKRLEDSAKSESLYNFFVKNSFLLSESVHLKSNYSRGKQSPWSLAFADHCLKDVFGIENPVFCAKFAEAISGDGQEARKITTLHSSSLVSLLVFYSVSNENPIYMEIDGRIEKFTESHFEVKNKVDEGSNNYSNVDVVLYGDNCVLYLESKFSEYLKTGPVEVKETHYYKSIYDKLKDYLAKAGLKLVSIDGKNLLDTIDGNPFYSEGIKQMISHFLGVTNEVKSGRLITVGKTVALGEILFDFADRVPNATNKKNSYNSAYMELRKGLKRCSEDDQTGIVVNELATYQGVLENEKNKHFLKNLPKSIREFYRFNDLVKG